MKMTSVVWLVAGSQIDVPFYKLFNFSNHHLIKSGYQVVCNRPPTMPPFHRFHMHLTEKDKTVISVAVEHADLDLLFPVTSIINNIVTYTKPKIKIVKLENRTFTDYVNTNGSVDATFEFEIITTKDIDRIEMHLMKSYVPIYHSGCHRENRIASIKSVYDFIHGIMKYR